MTRIAVAAAAALLVLGVGLRIWRGVQPQGGIHGQEANGTSGAMDGAILEGAESTVAGTSGGAADSESAVVVNPFTSCSGAEELASQSGVPIVDLRNLPFTAANTEYSLIDGSLAQIVYSSGDGGQIVYRGQAGEEDPSGDYEDYKMQQTVSVAGRSVTIKGNGQLIYLAVWTDGGYTYSISSSEGVTKEAMTGMVEGTMD